MSLSYAMLPDDNNTEISAKKCGYNNVMDNRGVCWVSSAVYQQPLEATAAKKWQLLAQGIAHPLYVIGFAVGWRPTTFQQGARFILLPRPPIAPLRYILFYTSLPWLLLWLVARYRVRVIISQSPFHGLVPAILKELLKLLGLRLRVIVENHNNFEEDLFLQRHIPLAPLIRRALGAIAHYTLCRADLCRVISTSTEAQVKRYAPQAPVVRCMTWTDDSVFRYAVRERPLSQSKDLVYVGVLIPRKGVHHLLNAYAQVSDIAGDLYLVGAPDNADYARALRHQCDTLGLRERVHFIGQISQAELARYYGRARAMVLPSLSEGLGRVVVEAMLCGTPVVASRVGGIPDLVRDGDNGWLVPAADESALAQVLRHALTSADIEAVGRRAQQFAQAYFSPSNYLAAHQLMLSLVFSGEQTKS